QSDPVKTRKPRSISHLEPGIAETKRSESQRRRIVYSSTGEICHFARHVVYTSSFDLVSVRRITGIPKPDCRLSCFKWEQKFEDFEIFMQESEVYERGFYLAG